MTRRLSIFALLLAWCCAQGALWDVVQVFAWTRMFADYAQTQTLSEALANTFDAEKPCELCRTVLTARAATADEAPASAQPTLPNASVSKVLLLALTEAHPHVFPPALAAFPRCAHAYPLNAPADPVPLPPPRAVA